MKRYSLVSSLAWLALLASVVSSSASARSITVATPPLQTFPAPAELQPTQNPLAAPPTFSVPTPSGDCRIKLVPATPPTRGHLAHCTATGVTFSGPLINCEHLAPDEQANACFAAANTMPNGSRNRELRRPSTPATPAPERKSR